MELEAQPGHKVIAVSEDGERYELGSEGCLELEEMDGPLSVTISGHSDDVVSVETEDESTELYVYGDKDIVFDCGVRVIPVYDGEWSFSVKRAPDYVTYSTHEIGNSLVDNDYSEALVLQSDHPMGSVRLEE